MTSDEFRKAGHRIVDWIADYRQQIESRPVMSPARPGEIKAKLPAAPPEHPEKLDDIIADLDRIIAPGLTNWQHPRFFGYFPGNALYSSVLGDLVGTGLGVIGLAWQSSPAVTEVEEVVTDWMRQMLGLSSGWSGVILDTASTSSLVALLCARERATNFGSSRGGLQSELFPFTIYTTAHSHSSVEKAALLAGFGRHHLRMIAHDANCAMDPEALAKAVREDVAGGRKPAAVVATIGTTASTAFDPLLPIATIAREHQMWMHVDAAMAGSAMILPECRYLWSGVEQADSLIVNPHKWLGTPFDCSLYFIRDPEHLVRVMSTNPSYLHSAADGQVKNYRDWGLQLGRRFRALKLWFLIREQGIEGLQARLRRDIENAHWLEFEIAKTPGWRVLAPVPLQTLCVRHEPPGLTGEALDKYTQEWCARINSSGRAYLTPAILDGRWMVRVSIGAEQTERRHVAELWELMKQSVSAG